MSPTRLAGAYVSLAVVAGMVPLSPAVAVGRHVATRATGVSAAVANPAVNVSVPVDYAQACWPDPTTAACRDALLSDIDYARSVEGVGPMVLPTDYDNLDPATQTFVVTNLERADRGLLPVAGVAAQLSATAQDAAVALTDPQFTGTTVGPLAGTWWTAIWANTPNVLMADLLWMYQDGWGGADTTNLDCTAPDAAGCWGHRDNILSAYGGARVLVAGVGASSNWGESLAELVVGGNGALPPLTYSWAQALNDGAGGPADLAAWQTLTAPVTAAAGATRSAATPAKRHHRKHKRSRRRH